MKTMTDSLLKNAMLLATILALSASPAPAYPPDNAAVLYYHAFLLYEPNHAMKSPLDDYRQGRIQRTADIERYLAENAPIIKMVLDATQIDRCDWGLDYSQGTEVLLPHHVKVREVFFLVAADATLQADTGHYRKAFERCVGMYRMARHLNERPLLCYLIGTAIAASTNKCVVRFLSEMPQDAGVLTWLRGELAAFDQQAFSVSQALVWKREAGVISMSPERIRHVAEAGLDDGPLKTQVFERIRTADSQFYARNIAYWNDFMARIEAAFKMPYEDAAVEIQRLDKKRADDFAKNPDATMTACLDPEFSSIHLLSVRLDAQSNAIRAAVEVYAHKAQTGQLPETLPATAPVDPFSGKPFLYEKGEDHFTLRWHIKDTSAKAENNQYQFQIK